MLKDQLLRKLKYLTVQPQWETLDEYLGLIIEEQLGALTNSTSWEDAKETQGRIKALRAIRTLPTVIQSMDN